jgi:hypothetical protein
MLVIAKKIENIKNAADKCKNKFRLPHKPTTEEEI